jgi:hypothetical protein
MSVIVPDSKFKHLFYVIAILSVGAGSISIYDWVKLKNVKKCEPEQTTSGAFIISCSTSSTSGALITSNSRTDYQCNENYRNKLSLGIFIPACVQILFLLVLAIINVYNAHSTTSPSDRSMIPYQINLMMLFIGTCVKLTFSHFLKIKECYDIQYILHSSAQSIDVAIIICVIIYVLFGSLENYVKG